MDAIPPDVLRTLVHNSIVQHIDVEALELLERTEDAERETLDNILQGLTGDWVGGGVFGGGAR